VWKTAQQNELPKVKCETLTESLRIAMNHSTDFKADNDLLQKAFNTSKYKCVLVHSNCARCCNLLQYGGACSLRIQISGNDIEFVDSYYPSTQSRHIITSEFYDSDDNVEK
jgi:hypothetical protein